MREEFGAIKSELKEVREKNRRLKSQIEQERSERSKVAQEDMMGGIVKREIYIIGGDI